MPAVDGTEGSGELKRLRDLVGPSEISYTELLEDREQAVLVAKKAAAEAGELRGHIVDLSVQLSRARQDLEYQQVSAAMSRPARVVYRVRRRIATSVTPRVAALVRRVRRTLST
jgi:hypothetical protein